MGLDVCLGSTKWRPRLRPRHVSILDIYALLCWYHLHAETDNGSNTQSVNCNAYVSLINWRAWFFSLNYLISSLKMHMRTFLDFIQAFSLNACIEYVSAITRRSGRVGCRWCSSGIIILSQKSGTTGSESTSLHTCGWLVLVGSIFLSSTLTLHTFMRIFFNGSYFMLLIIWLH